LTAKLNLQQL